MRAWTQWSFCRASPPRRVPNDDATRFHPALGDIADNVNVGFKFVQLRGIEAFVYVYAQGFELGAHRRIHLRVATADFKPRFFGNGGHPAHKRAADTDNVDVFHDKTVF